jgi:hypothetical protein
MLRRVATRRNIPEDTILHSQKQKTNSVALSPPANYTNWATATCRRNLVSTFVDRGVSILHSHRCEKFKPYKLLDDL